MKKTLALAALAAGAAPRAVCASPRAEAPADPAALVAQINTAFNAYREANDKRLEQLEAGGEDPVTAEQVKKIDADISALTKALEKTQSDLAAAQLGAGSASPLTADQKAHASAFDAFFRKGREPSSGMRELEVKAGLTTQSDPDGGFLVPEEMESTIDRVLGTVSTMRSLARVQSISGDTYKKLVSMGGAEAGWVGEEEARPETDGPSLREIAISTGEIYANPAATQKLLDDSRVDIAQWLADEVSISFAEKEGAAFVSGNGINKPRGFLAYDTVANASWAWGKLGFTVTGAAAAFAASNPADALIGLLYSLKQGYRNGASFLTSDAVLSTIRQFKDGQGNYLFQPPSGAEGVPTLLGKPVHTDDNMPALGAGAFPVAVGDFKRGYMIVDRFGQRVLRDPYTNKPNVHFYTTKRVGGAVTNFEAIKLLKCST